MPPGEWGWHPRLSSRLGTYRLVQMPGSHELMFSNPVGLADKIPEAGRIESPADHRMRSSREDGI
jgi:hypothetical protein